MKTAWESLVADEEVAVTVPHNCHWRGHVPADWGMRITACIRCGQLGRWNLGHVEWIPDTTEEQPQ